MQTTPARPGVSVMTIQTESGPARVHLYQVTHGVPRASLILGHGAGGGVESKDLSALAADLPRTGIEVALVEQPWAVAGKRIAEAGPKLDGAWVECVHALRRSGVGLRRLVVGGRSTGARVACRTVEQTKPDAVVCLAFPLHPPHRPDVTRADELAAAAAVVPVTVVQGAMDPYGDAAEVAAAAADFGQRVLVVSIPFAGHSMELSARATITDDEARLVLGETVRRAILARRGNTGLLLSR